jgi:hypothetical protein
VILKIPKKNKIQKKNLQKKELHIQAILVKKNLNLIHKGVMIVLKVDILAMTGMTKVKETIDRTDLITMTIEVLMKEGHIITATDLNIMIDLDRTAIGRNTEIDLNNMATGHNMVIDQDHTEIDLSTVTDHSNTAIDLNNMATDPNMVIDLNKGHHILIGITDKVVTKVGLLNVLRIIEIIDRAVLEDLKPQGNCWLIENNWLR